MKKRIVRRFLTLLTATALAVTGTSSSAYAMTNIKKAERDSVPGKVLAKFTFDDLETGFVGGGAKASCGAEPSLSGDGISKNALVMNGNIGSVLKVTKENGESLLTGQEEFTISYWSKVDTRIDPNWAAWIARDDLAVTEDYINYIGILDRGNQVRAERYLGGRTWDGSSDTVLGQWKQVTLSVGEESTALYINGEKRLEDTRSGYRAGDILGDNSVFYIGKANWGGGEYFKGQLDEYMVYEGTVTDEEAMELYLEGAGQEIVMEQLCDSLTIPEAPGGYVMCADVDRLTLESSLMNGRGSVTWKSSNKQAIADDGKVTAPEQAAEVLLTAEITAGSLMRTKEFLLQVIPEGGSPYSITIDPKKEGQEISQELFGLFFEDINSAADGGLYPEMVKNNSFENYFNIVSIEERGRGNEYTWKLHWNSDQDKNFTVISDPSGKESMNEKNTNFARVTGDMALQNGGFAPMSDPNSAAMPIEKDEKYDFSIWTRSEKSYSGTMKVKVVDASGRELTEEKEIPLAGNGTWQKTEGVVFTGKDTAKGKMVVTISGAGEGQSLDMDFVSLSPQDTYGYGNKNYAYGKGVRKDLVEKLMALNPSFVRFPGGCIIEGNSGRDSYYNWENSVGPLEERRATCNLWASDDGSNRAKYGYMQSFGFGYHEILTLCEDMGAQAFPILSAGVFCQFANGDNAPAASGEELEKFARHATHLIDYCWGSPLSSDRTQAEWAMKRVRNGHEAQFDLNYIGIGNENWREKYFNNFKYIKDYVETYVTEHYPGRKITIISSAGPSSGGDSYEFAWRWLNDNAPGETLLDEHYYQSREFMLTNTDRYDYYNRLEAGGSNVFLGEYATHLSNRNNILESAICDAAYMTGLERNGDILRHASYAPLLEKIGGRNWETNLIHFDEYDSFATPNYYTQQMYAQNYGERVVNTALAKQGELIHLNHGSPVLATWSTGGYVTHVKVTREDGKVLLEDDFTENGKNTAGYRWESLDGSDGGFTIADGRLTLSQGNGKNGVWLPEAARNPEWYNYTVEATVVKTSGAEGILIGAGAKDSGNYYWYNVGGWNNTRNGLEHIINGITSGIGNGYKTSYRAVNTGEEMELSFNYGVEGKLEAGYTTAAYDNSKEFSARLNPYQTDIYQVCSKDDQYIYLKLVNQDNYEKKITLDYRYRLSSDEAEIICMSGDGNAANDIGKEQIKPVTTTVKLRDSRLAYTIPAMSFTVIKVKCGTADVSELNKQIQAAKALDAGKYTEESYAKVKEALEKAQKADLTDQKAVDEAAEAMREAIAGLKEKPGSGQPVPVNPTPDHPSPGDTDADKPVKAVPKTGQTTTVGRLVYKVTKSAAAGGNVAVVRPSKKTWKSLTVPKSILWNGYTFKVTAISKNAFRNNKKLSSVKIGDHVTSIGVQAFAGCSRLKKAVIGKGVKTIGSRVFYQCKSLRKVSVKSTKLNRVSGKAFAKIYRKAVVDVSSKKVKRYKKLLRKAGLPQSAKVK